MNVVRAWWKNGSKKRLGNLGANDGTLKFVMLMYREVARSSNVLVDKFRSLFASSHCYGRGATKEGTVLNLHLAILKQAPARLSTTITKAVKIIVYQSSRITIVIKSI